MSDERKPDDEALESEEAEPLPGSAANSLTNPAPGDMPVDPPLKPGRLLPTEDTQ